VSELVASTCPPGTSIVAGLRLPGSAGQPDPDQRAAL